MLDSETSNDYSSDDFVVPPTIDNTDDGLIFVESLYRPCFSFQGSQIPLYRLLDNSIHRSPLDKRWSHRSRQSKIELIAAVSDARRWPGRFSRLLKPNLLRQQRVDSFRDHPSNKPDYRYRIPISQTVITSLESGHRATV